MQVVQDDALQGLASALFGKMADQILHPDWGFSQVAVKPGRPVITEHGAEQAIASQKVFRPPAYGTNSPLAYALLALSPRSAAR